MAPVNGNTDLNPNAGGGTNGTSSIYKQGTTPNTRTAVSQKVRILTPAYGSTSMTQMGVISSFNVSESKSVEANRGIGFGDVVAELVPSVTEPRTASIERALLYLCNLWQSTGYAAGSSGPARSLRHHRWPFDIEEQLVYPSLIDSEITADGNGYSGTPGSFDGGMKAISFPKVTGDASDARHSHSAEITINEACWFNSYSKSLSKDAGIIMESGDVTITDVHDFASVYGEFLATGNDPTIGQLGSIRYSGKNYRVSQSGGGFVDTI